MKYALFFINHENIAYYYTTNGSVPDIKHATIFTDGKLAYNTLAKIGIMEIEHGSDIVWNIQCI